MLGNLYLRFINIWYLLSMLVCAPRLTIKLIRMKVGYMKYTRYWCLFDYIRKHKPKQVLEIGGGKSTIFLSHLLHTYGGRLDSYEPDIKWHEYIKSQLPHDNVRLLSNHYHYMENIYDLIFLDRDSELPYVAAPTIVDNRKRICDFKGYYFYPWLRLGTNFKLTEV